MGRISFISDPNSAPLSGNPDRSYALAYMKPFMQGPARKRIYNLETRALLLDTGNLLFPLTINDEEYDNSYICSPYTACVSYAQEEMGKLGVKPLEAILYLLSASVGILLKKAQINKVASVNNWMLSTNLYPAWNGYDVAEIRDALIQAYPDHALMFRSLNRHSNDELIQAFIRDGFIIVPSRQVYIFDGRLSSYMQKHNSRIDAAVLQKTKYKVVPHEDITEADYPRIVELYNMLYLEKYSLHNPQFTVPCIADWHKGRLLEMTGLRNPEGTLDGIVGCFERNSITTAPLVGYDTSGPKNAALYRMLMALVMRRAHDKGMTLNLSSGASGFKILRGGVPFTEYSAVYIRHLSLGRRCVWHLTNFLLTFIGVPLMKAFKL